MAFLFYNTNKKASHGLFEKRVSSATFFRNDPDEDTLDELSGEFANLFGLEFDDTAFESVQRIIGAFLHIFPHVILRPALTDDDIARLRELAAIDFDAEPLGDGIAAESGRSACFSGCHRIVLLLYDRKTSIMEYSMFSGLVNNGKSG